MSSFDSYGRYVYGHFRSEEIAEKALEDMFASGEVSEVEFPMVEKRRQLGLSRKMGCDFAMEYRFARERMGITERDQEYA
jgi:hypothetical protein